LQGLSIFLAILAAAIWMAAVSYVDYQVAQLVRLSNRKLSEMNIAQQLFFKTLKFPVSDSLWIVSGVIVLFIAVIFGLIDFWFLFILVVIGTIVLAFALYSDVQQIEQVYRSIPVSLPVSKRMDSHVSSHAQLLGIQGEYVQKTLEFHHEITIGRNKENGIRLLEGSVSRIHARIVCANDQWFIQDKESKTGIYVNNQKINGAQRIYQGDRIRIASSEFRFTCG
jgi:hypothetical protein